MASMCSRTRWLWSRFSDERSLKAFCTNNNSGSLVRDAQHNVTTTLVGERDTVLSEPVRIELGLRLLELEALILWVTKPML